MQAPSSAGRRWHRAVDVTCVLALIVVPALVIAQRTPASPPATASPRAAAPGQTVERIRQSRRLRLGYRPDARPFSYRDESGRPAGYTVALCEQIADAANGDAALGVVEVEWVPVTAEDRIGAVQQGEVDLLCGADTVTVSRRAAVSFSIPVFPGGLGAMVRADAPARLREALNGDTQTHRPVWRASAARVLQARAFAAVAGTTTEAWLKARISELRVIADVSLVPDYGTGIQELLSRRSDVFFGERAVLIDAARRHPSARDLVVVDRLFTWEPLAIAFSRGDEPLRLFVDRALSRIYGSGELGHLYTHWFGEPDAITLAFFRWNTLPD